MKSSSILGKCYGSFRKVFIVMYWKNLTLKLRHYVQTLLEILVPTLLFAAVLAIYLEGGESFTPAFVAASSTEPQTSIEQFCRQVIFQPVLSFRENVMTCTFC